MKKNLLILPFAFAMAIQSSCGEDTNTSVVNQVNKIMTPERPVISSETAVMIARGFLCFDFDLRDRKVSVTETSDTWHVQFVRTKNLHAEGGDPSLVISKKNGEIISGNVAK